MSTSSQPQTWTIQKLLDWTTGYLASKASESARLDAEILLAHALGCDRVALYTQFDDVVQDPGLSRFRGMVHDRAKGAPVASLVGHKEFFSLDFQISPDVLIPRPETEFVILAFLEQAKGKEAPVVVDLGTGSGNITITVAHSRPDARLWAVDISANTLAVAAANAQRHGVADRVKFCEGDLFAPLPAELRGRVQFILSNPPYIATADMASLPVGVKDYEPHVALDGGPGGLDVVKRIVAESPQWLAPGGQLVLEIGAAQEAGVRGLFASDPAWRLAPTVHDYAGHPRVVRAGYGADPNDHKTPDQPPSTGEPQETTDG
jgi:release factor glutamine methyltransferase